MRYANSVRNSFLCFVVLSFSLSLPVTTAARELTYDYTSRIAVGDGFNAFRVVDIDRDGRLDIVGSRGASIGFDPGGVDVLLGKGDGTFDDVSTVPVGIRPTGLAIEDMNEDGAPDLVVITRPSMVTSERLITITPGNGDGTFDTTNSTTKMLDGFTFDVQVDDIDNDGNLDAFFVNGRTEVLDVYPGNGDGTLGDLVNITLGAQLRSVATGDFDRNGLTDIAALESRSSPGLLRVYLADGAGGFTNPATYMTQGLGSGIVAEDATGDGLLDIVAGESGGNLQVLAGNGDGSFDDPDVYLTDRDANSIEVFDVDGNGATDIVVGHGNSEVFYSSVLAGNGDGSFAPTVYVPTGTTTRLGVGDFDRDGRAELVSFDFESAELLVIRGNDRGTFGQSIYQPFGDSPRRIAKGDLDGDNRVDMVVTERRLLTSRLGNGDGTFTDFFTASVGLSQPQQVELVDVNNDGDLDFLYANVSRDSLEVFLGAGNGTFGPRSSYLPTTEFPAGRALATGNIDGDNDIDAVVGVETPGLIQVARNNGSGRFTDSSDITGVGKPRALALGNLSGTPAADIAVGTRIELNPGFTYKILLLEGNGDGSFDAPVELFQGSAPNAMEIVDIDGDGNKDLAWTDLSDNVSLLYSDGAGGFLPRVQVPTGDGPFDLDFADLNRDGLLDFTTSNGFDQTTTIFIRQADGSYAGSSMPSGQRSDTLAIADDDGDGTPDLNIVTFRSAGFPVVDHETITVFPGNLAPEIVSVTAAPGAAGPGSIDFAVTIDDPDSDSFSARWDFDGDDRFDRTADGLTTTYAYPRSGSFDVSVRVYDDEGSSALGATTVEVQIIELCEVNGDGVIDRNDIGAILAARNQAAAPDDPRDADGDGVITVLDARQCMLRCTNSRCAP